MQRQRVVIALVAMRSLCGCVPDCGTADWCRYDLVKEALAERAHMIAAAPFMVKPLPIMIPIYKLWQVPRHV